jgi:hypothetical protein
MPNVKFSALNQNLELYYELHGSDLLINGGFFREQPKYQVCRIRKSSNEISYFGLVC